METVKKLYEEIKKRVQTGMRKGTLILMDELKKITPEKTKEMLNSYKIGNMEEDANGNMSISVGNTAEHSIYVEYGVKGKIYRYHKPAGPEPRPVIYAGVGNRTFARATDKSRKKVTDLIYKELL